MKTQTYILICVLAGICGVMLCLAAKEEWSVDGEAMIRQVMADGTGGCALMRMDTNDVETVVWVDRFGKPLYQAAASNAYIISCSKKQLLYSDRLNGGAIIQVDNKGTVTRIAAPQSVIQGPSGLIYPSNEMADPKGFFGIKQVITSPGASQVLVRFNNK